MCVVVRFMFLLFVVSLQLRYFFKMKKILSSIDAVIRLPLHLMHYGFFLYFNLSSYTRDRTQLVLTALFLSTFVYWAPILFDEYIENFKFFINYLEKQAPREGFSGGIIYQYQALIAGVSAIFAGFIALLSPVLAHYFEKYKLRREFTMRLRAWAITTNVDVKSILNSENPLQAHNIECLRNRKPAFLNKETYWAFSDDKAYLANGIGLKLNDGVDWLNRLLEGDDDSYEAKLIKLDGALQSFCSALIDAENFMAATLDGHWQIVEFYNNPDISVFIKRNRGPVKTFLREQAARALSD